MTETKTVERDMSVFTKQLAPGSCSSCEKLFPTIPRPDFSYSTMTRSTAWKCQRRCAR
jgi:hypothetical protein